MIGNAKLDNLLRGILTFSILYFLSVLCFNSHADDDGRKVLKAAWKEYGFQEFSKAEDLFKEASEAVSNTKDYADAMTGIAFCYQFGKKDSVSSADLQYAMLCYKKALERIESSTSSDKSLTRVANFLKSMILECKFRLAIMNNEFNIQELWNEAEEIIQNANDEIIAQDTLLNLLLLQTKDFFSEQTDMLLKKAEMYMKKQASKQAAEKKDLSIVICRYLFMVHYWRKEYKQSVDWMIKYYELGPTCYAYKANILFQIARTAEIKLKDYTLAGKYYKEFLKHVKSDRRIFFAQQKVKELSR